MYKDVVIKRGDVLKKSSSRYFLRCGVNLVYGAVAPTLSPKGRNSCIIIPGQLPLITNDGATIAKSVVSKNTKINAGVDLIKLASLKTNEIAGDGTTTSVILTKHLSDELLNLLDSEAVSELDIVNSLDKVKASVRSWAESEAIRITGIEDLVKVAKVSSGNETIGNLIGKAYKEVGLDGMVTCVSGNSIEDKVVIKKGYSWDKGHIHPALITDQTKLETVVEGDVCVILYSGKITHYPENVVVIMRELIQQGKKLIIISEDFDHTAYPPMLATNCSIVGVKAPGFGDRQASLFKDLEALTGATLVGGYSKIGDLSQLSINHIGHIQSATIKVNETVIVGQEKYSEAVNNRAYELSQELKSATHEYDKDTLTRRISKLKNGIAQIEVGAITEVEMKEKKLRVEDALCASRAAIESGYCSGGGLPYLRFIQQLRKLDLELSIHCAIKNALESPLRVILQNCYVKDIEETIDRIAEYQDYEETSDVGYNALTGDIENLLESGIIDPIKVVESVLVNSLSVVKTLITVETMVELSGGER